LRSFPYRKWPDSDSDLNAGGAIGGHGVECLSQCSSVLQRPDRQRDGVNDHGYALNESEERVKIVRSQTKERSITLSCRSWL
jgi:hypothetical protein